MRGKRVVCLPGRRTNEEGTMKSKYDNSQPNGMAATHTMVRRFYALPCHCPTMSS